MAIDTTQITTVVQTGKGSVRGAVVDGIHVFKGMPYAAPPFGADHLRPPQPVRPWTGVRDALDWGAEPPQPRMPPGAEGAGDLVYDPATPGEDCLNLNIWTPNPTATGLPVFVWIPGGMFEVCSSASYDGSRFARDGVVCVTINYRVGVEGFLFTSDGVPNRGLLDQLAALDLQNQVTNRQSLSRRVEIVNQLTSFTGGNNRDRTRRWRDWRPRRGWGGGGIWWPGDTAAGIILSPRRPVGQTQKQGENQGHRPGVHSKSCIRQAPGAPFLGGVWKKFAEARRTAGFVSEASSQPAGPAITFGRNGTS